LITTGKRSTICNQETSWLTYCNQELVIEYICHEWDKTWQITEITIVIQKSVYRVNFALIVIPSTSSRTEQARESTTPMLVLRATNRVGVRSLIKILAN